MNKKDIEKMLLDYIATRPILNILVSKDGPTGINYPEDPQWVIEAKKILLNERQRELNQERYLFGQSHHLVQEDENGDIEIKNIPFRDIYK